MFTRWRRKPEVRVDDGRPPPNPSRHRPSISPRRAAARARRRKLVRPRGWWRRDLSSPLWQAGADARPLGTGGRARRHGPLSAVAGDAATKSGGAMAGCGGGAVDTTILCWVGGRSRAAATTLLSGDSGATGLGWRWWLGPGSTACYWWCLPCAVGGNNDYGCWPARFCDGAVASGRCCLAPLVAMPAAAGGTGCLPFFFTLSLL